MGKNKIIASKEKKINYLEAEQIARSRILDKGRSQVLEMDLEINWARKPQVLDADEVQKSGNLGPGFWKGLNKLIFMILYSIKLELRSQSLEGIDRWMYKW